MKKQKTKIAMFLLMVLSGSGYVHAPSSKLTVAVYNPFSSDSLLNNPYQYDVELLEEYAKEKGKVLFLNFYPTLTEMNEAKADIKISPLNTRLSSRIIRNDTSELVCNKTVSLGKENVQLVVENSEYQKAIAQKIQKNYAKISRKVSQEFTQDHLLSFVNQGKIDCTIALSNHVRIVKRFYPSLKTVVGFPQKDFIKWGITGGNLKLKQSVDNWFSQESTFYTVARLKDQSDYTNELTSYEFASFTRSYETRLPHYTKIFKKAEKLTQIPWKLLAAIAYQESRWDPFAKSFTGVRGIMMLTNSTASLMNISDRLNPEQSIIGGAKYLHKILQKIPNTINSKDKIWYALAAYNMGYGHLLDVMKLAKSLGKNPNYWQDVQSILPLLSDKNYYSFLEYGKARGYEPVQYVKYIKNYYDKILFLEDSKSKVADTNLAYHQKLLFSN